MVSRNDFLSVCHPYHIASSDWMFKLIATACNINIIININSNINIDVTITININIIINIKLLKDFMMSYLACSSSTCSLLGSVTLGTGIGEPESWEVLSYFFSTLICLHLKTLIIVKSYNIALRNCSNNSYTTMNAFVESCKKSPMTTLQL